MGPVGRVGGRGTSQVVHAVFGRRRPVPAAGLPAAWTSALDRFARSVHRFHDRVEVIGDRKLRKKLQQSGVQLDEALGVIRKRAREPLARRDGLPTVRSLLRAGTLCAHATECAVGAAAARRSHDGEGAARLLDDVRAVVAELVAELETTDPDQVTEERRAEG